ncbi:Transposon Tf2-9 poly [Paramuricea clavata]|uniref:Transposon Tf2-9 poly n=1 Tax=Paramuricea clavata TaxID=317549 RepID=A0A6S7FTH9_PARCT|nr:Transposon Tf2-9 poly [Paramuricea clavata]
MRRVPYHLRDKLSKKLDELLDLDIIEEDLRPESDTCRVSAGDGYVKFVAREATPVAMTTREIERESEHYPELQSVRECIMSGKWDCLVHKEYLPVRRELCAIGQLVLCGTKIVVPQNLREQIPKLAHEGHPGIVAMKQRLRKFTKSTTAEKLVSILSRILVTHGLPLSIRIDDGPQFIIECLKNFLVENGIEQQMTTPLWPQANGETERQNRSILKRLRIAQAEGRNLRLEVRKEKGTIYAVKKRNAVESNIQAGDKVLVKQDKKNKLSTFFNPEPFRVLQKNGNSILVEADTGVQYKRNITHLKKLVTPDAEENEINTQESILQECSISEPKLLDGRRLGEDEGGRVKPSRAKRLPDKLKDYVVESR